MFLHLNIPTQQSIILVLGHFTPIGQKHVTPIERNYGFGPTAPLKEILHTKNMGHNIKIIFI